MLRLLSSLVLMMLGVSTGAVLTSRAAPGRAERALSPGHLDAAIIALCWMGALLTIRRGVTTSIALAIWIAAGFLASFGIHFSRAASRTGQPPLGAHQKVSVKESRGWRAFAVAVGGFQSRLILGAVYFLVIAPFGITVGWFGDVLNTRGQPGEPAWRKRESVPPTVEDGRRQY